jgi:hypothetical protein
MRAIVAGRGGHCVDAKHAASAGWERLAHAGAGLGTALAGRASQARDRLEDVGPELQTAWQMRVEDGRVRYALAGLGLGLLVGSMLGNQFGILPATGRVSATVHWAGWAAGTVTLLGAAVGLWLCLTALVLRTVGGRDWPSRRRRVAARIRAKAATVPGFAEQLKISPRGTFDRELGPKTPVPDGFEVTVHEETPAHWYVVLPPLGTKKPGPWAVRAEDGRIDYATGSCGLGLIAGSLLSIVSDNMHWFNWTSFGWAPLAFLGLVCGFGLPGARHTIFRDRPDLAFPVVRSFASQVRASQPAG